jgi:hypothetical protein
MTLFTTLTYIGYCRLESKKLCFIIINRESERCKEDQYVIVGTMKDKKLVYYESIKRELKIFS